MIQMMFSLFIYFCLHLYTFIHIYTYFIVNFFPFRYNHGGHTQQRTQWVINQ